MYLFCSVPSKLSEIQYILGTRLETFLIFYAMDVETKELFKFKKH